MTILHSALYDANSHKPGYIQSGDPGAVGAGIIWVDTSGGTGLWVIKVRDATDTGWEVIYPPDHAAGHERGGGDALDGDHIEITLTPSNYTPDTTPSEAANVDDLAAHLAGIDNALGGASGYTDTLLYRHTATKNTSGGTATSGSDQTLPLTEETYDTGNHGSLSSNQVTLAAGTYEYELSHIFIYTGGAALLAQMWLYNASDAADIPDSESIVGQPNGYTGPVLSGRGEFTIASSKTIEARYRVSSNGSLGIAGNFREECYGFLFLKKVG